MFMRAKMAGSRFTVLARTEEEEELVRQQTLCRINTWIRFSATSLVRHRHDGTISGL